MMNKEKNENPVMYLVEVGEPIASMCRKRNDEEVSCEEYILNKAVVRYKTLAEKYGKEETNLVVWEMIEKGKAYFDETWDMVILCSEDREKVYQKVKEE